jgi:hypothetical protein
MKDNYSIIQNKLNEIGKKLYSEITSEIKQFTPFYKDVLDRILVKYNNIIIEELLPIEVEPDLDYILSDDGILHLKINVIYDREHISIKL